MASSKPNDGVDVYTSILGSRVREATFYGPDAALKAERYGRLLCLLSTMAEALRSENKRDGQAALNEYYRIMGS